MDRARKNEPRSNKILYEAELRFRKEMHEKKLRAVKSSVDTSAPKNFGVVSAPYFFIYVSGVLDSYLPSTHSSRLLVLAPFIGNPARPRPPHLALFFHPPLLPYSLLFHATFAPSPPFFYDRYRLFSRCRPGVT